jgi:glycosyltransferase involved in cell wall biosynthesis
MEVKLVVPIRRNKIKGDPFEFYDLRKNFEIKRIKSFDFVGFFPKLGRVSFWLQNIFFNVAVAFFNVGDSVIYTRSGLVAFIFRLRGKRVFFESHRILNSAWIYKLFFGRKVKIISLTHEAKKNYLKLGIPKENIIVAPDGVDLSVFDIEISKKDARNKLGLPQDKKIIGYFGSFKTMGHDKGLLDAVKSLKNLADNVLLLAVGGLNGEVKEYQKKAQKIVNKEKFIFKNPVSRSELAIYQKACDVLLIPFPWNKHFAYYASALKMFEYMASKRPIVATDLPSSREVLDDSNAVLILPEDPNALAAAVKKLVDDKVLGDRLSARAFEDVKNYTWQKRAEEILKFISK